MKAIFTTLAFFLLTLTGVSQAPLGYDFCGTEYDPNALEPYQVNFQASANRTVEWKTIPIVVHIVYSDSIPGSYFTEGYVDTAIADVNDHFAEAYINFDLQAINYKNLGDYAWHNLVVNGSVCFPTSATLNTIVANDISWDEDYYCNIYIIANMCDYVLGWSYITNYVLNARDGVWINYKAFGLGAPFLTPRNNENKVLTHELGHYCGLHHVFNGVYSCMQDAELHDSQWYQYGDLVADTPPIKPSWHCDDDACQWFLWPDGPPNWNSNRPWADYEHNNHMDYYADSCRQHFTAGQIERMHTMLEFQRHSVYDPSYPPFCFGDLNGDGIVGVLDLLQIIGNYGEHSLVGDLDNNGITGSTDLLLLLNVFDTNCNDPEGIFYEPPVVTYEKSNIHLLLRELEKIK